MNIHRISLVMGQHVVLRFVSAEKIDRPREDALLRYLGPEMYSRRKCDASGFDILIHDIEGVNARFVVTWRASRCGGERTCTSQVVRCHRQPASQLSYSLTILLLREPKKRSLSKLSADDLVPVPRQLAVHYYSACACTPILHQ